MTDWIEVPPDRLQPETLEALLDEACTRDGTELSDATVKRNQLRKALQQGRIQLRFYPATQAWQLEWVKPA